MTDLTRIFLYRLTHLQNIQHVLRHGITHISSVNKNNNFVSIGDSSLINSRTGFRLPFGRRLGEYIPFYFGVRMPMLYVIQNGFNGVTPTSANNIVYCVTSVKSIMESNINFIFSDGHAIDGFSSFYSPDAVNKIETIVDFKAVKAQYWKSDTDLDLKRRREAEFLVLGDVPKEAIIGFAVYNQAAADTISKMEAFEGKKLIVKPNYYF